MVLLSVRWQKGWDGVLELAGNPLYFGGVLAAATIALSRPRGARSWAMACLAGVIAGALLLGGASAAGSVMELVGAENPASRLAVHLLLALPAIAAATLSVLLLSPPPNGDR